MNEAKIQKLDMSEKGWNEFRERVRQAALKNPGRFCRADNCWLGEDVIRAVSTWVEAHGGTAYLEELEEKAEAARKQSLSQLLQA